jgi:hypothetical protein
MDINYDDHYDVPSTSTCNNTEPTYRLCKDCLSSSICDEGKVILLQGE